MCVCVFLVAVLLCPEMTLLARTYVTKRRLIEFMPIFERIFGYDQFHDVLVLSMFWNFFFLTWPIPDQLEEMIEFAPIVVDQIYRVLVKFSHIPEVYDIIDLAELVERNLQDKRQFRVHPDFQIILRDSVFLNNIFHET